MFRLHYLIVCLGFLVQTKANVVSFIKPCKATDEACLLSSSQNAVKYLAEGIPELGIPSSDPLYVSVVKSEEPGFKLIFQNVKIYGVSKAKLLKVSRDDHNIRLVIETPLRGIGQYELNGKIFIIEAFGEGDFEIKTDKVLINVDIRFKTIEKDGKKYWKITGYDYNFDLVKKVYIKLQNLFGGDEQRAKPFNELLDHSWKDIVYEIGGPLLKNIVAQYIDHIKNFLLLIPVNELELI